MADDIDDGGHVVHRALELHQGATALVDGEAGLGGGGQHAPHQPLALAHGVFVVLGVLRYLGGHQVYLAGELVQLVHHAVALVHHLLRGAGAVMDLLHLIHHLLQAQGDARQLARLLLLILLQAQDQAVVTRDYVPQLVALAPRRQQLCLAGGIELQEGAAQLQQGPDQPAPLHQRKQQGHPYQAERQGAEDGGELPVHVLPGGGEPLPHLAAGLQQLLDVLLHPLAGSLLLLQRLAAVVQLLRVALEQGDQLAARLLTKLMAHRLPQAEVVGRRLLKQPERRQPGQVVRLFLQGGQLELQSGQQRGAGLRHVVLAQVGQSRQARQYVGSPLAVSIGAGRIRPSRALLAIAQQGLDVGGQLVLGILQQPLAVAGELARRQVIAVDACAHPLEQGAQRGAR
ncbi:hypothetical protein D3C84_536530 [compost metagenome]